MYYIIMKDRAIGPFMRRDAAYVYVENVLKISIDFYHVASDRVCQQNYCHLPIEKAEISG